jgi:quercetin dioxygenase-like cupin family protein
MVGRTDSVLPRINLSRLSFSGNQITECLLFCGKIVRPWNYREESTMSNEQAAPETKGVTVKLLTTVDLGPEIEGMAGRQLRMRMVTIEPGGVFGPIHDHKDRPGTVYILQGTITDHRNGIVTDYGPGVGWPEDKNTTHWLENKGMIPAVEISVDIVRQE